MPKITLHLDIQIHNYSEIVINESILKAIVPKFGTRLTGNILSRVPKFGTRLESRVDSEIVERIKSSLGVEVASSLQEQLSKNDVNSKVSFSFQD